VRDGVDLKVFLSTGETNYFCEQDWTTQIRLNPLDKFSFTLARIPGLRARRAKPVMRRIACPGKSVGLRHVAVGTCPSVAGIAALNPSLLRAFKLGTD
jgi:hypothetical protein